MQYLERKSSSNRKQMERNRKDQEINFSGVSGVLSLMGSIWSGPCVARTIIMRDDTSFSFLSLLTNFLPVKLIPGDV